MINYIHPYVHIMGDAKTMLHKIQFYAAATQQSTDINKCM